MRARNRPGTPAVTFEEFKCHLPMVFRLVCDVMHNRRHHWDAGVLIEDAQMVKHHAEPKHLTFQIEVNAYDAFHFGMNFIPDYRIAPLKGTGCAAPWRLHPKGMLFVMALEHEKLHVNRAAIEHVGLVYRRYETLAGQRKRTTQQ